MDEDAPASTPPLARHPDRHPDDLPPDPSMRRGVPRGLLWAVALFIVVLTIASFRALSVDPTPTVGPDVVQLDGSRGGSPAKLGDPGPSVVGRSAPAASFVTFGGEQANLAAYAGKPVILNFWASSCTPCITEMPDLERVHQRYGDKVAFIGLATNDGEDAAREMAKRTGVSYALGFDPNGAIVTSFGGIGLPTTVAITREGVVAYAATKQLSQDELTRLIDDTLKP